MKYLIIGLGNVGRQYEFSRHNIGFDTVDLLASRHNLHFIPGKGDFFQASTQPDNPTANKPKAPSPANIFSWLRKLLGAQSPHLSESSPPISTESISVNLLKPTTLMNRSGLAAHQALELFSVEPQQLIVVVDDFNLPLGQLRLRKSGSDGGHNGLKSIISELKTDDFPRLRVGIGPKPPQRNIVEFVLGQFTESEQLNKKAAIGRAADACENILSIAADEPTSKKSSESKNPLDSAAAKYNIGSRYPAPGSD